MKRSSLWLPKLFTCFVFAEVLVTFLFQSHLYTLVLSYYLIRYTAARRRLEWCDYIVIFIETEVDILPSFKATVSLPSLTSGSADEKQRSRT